MLSNEPTIIIIAYDGIGTIPKHMYMYRSLSFIICLHVLPHIMTELKLFGTEI